MKRVLSATLLSASMLLTQTAQAASHPLTQVKYNATTGITYVDQVVAIDWDINNPPTLAIEGVNTLLNRAYIQAVMNGASDMLYTMTEGKMRLGKISVYSNHFLDNADILILNKDGRANAHVGGLNRRGSRNQMFTIGFGTAYEPAALGKVIGHEFGHYMLGVYDEYREVGQMDTSSAGRPQDRDTARNTVMHDQDRFSNLSNASDYADPLQRQTAHYRFFGQSAWETLVTDPKKDTQTIANGWPSRIWFESFKNMTAPTTLKQPKDTTESRADIRFAYMDGTSTTVIVIDTSVAADSLKGFVKAAEGVLDATIGGSQVAVLTVSGGQVTTLIPITTLPDNVKTEANRTTIREKLASLTASSATGGSLDSAITQAAVMASPLAAARSVATQAGTAMPMSNTIEVTRTPIISLFATSASSLKDETATLLTEGGVLLNSILLNAGGVDGNVGSVAGASRGSNVESKSAADLAKKAVQITNEAEGKLVQAIASTAAETLAAGAKISLKAPIGVSTVDGDVTFTAYVGDNKGMALTLLSPTGGSITVANAIAFGIESEVDHEDGTITFTIPKALPSRVGDWTATLTASVASVEGVDLVATAESLLSVKTQIIGGTAADPRAPVLTATVVQPLAVKGAVVTASIYDTNQVLVKEGLVLKDDGVAPDLSPGDGIYTASLASVIAKAGEYEIQVDISNDGLTAKYGTAGARIAGANTPDVPITQNFMREDSLMFAYAPAVATAVAATAAASGGGCTLGRNAPFDPLFPVLVVGAGLYLFRRFRKN